MFPGTRGSTNVSWLDDIKQKAENVIADVTGEARKDLEDALAAAQRAEQYVTDHSAELKKAVEVALAAVEPQAQSTVSQLLADFIQSVENALGTKVSSQPAPAEPPTAPQSPVVADTPAGGASS